jgi:small-conductance mechanosensitive channel
LIGWLEWVPTMVEVFGVAGMRTPASITVAGLLLAAIAFWDR